MGGIMGNLSGGSVCTRRVGTPAVGNKISSR